jgi:MFS family permease
MTWVSRLFLTGFASTALFGPLVGRLCDSYGRKAGTLAFTLLYSLGAYSTKSNLLGVLLAGRVLGGIGTSLLFSAPEAWLVGEAGREGVESSLGETFGLVSVKSWFNYASC